MSPGGTGMAPSWSQHLHSLAGTRASTRRPEAVIDYVQGSGRPARIYYASAAAGPTELVAGSQTGSRCGDAA